jgi:UrcA family protein
MSTNNRLITPLCIAALAMAATATQPASAQATTAEATEPAAETLVIIRAERPTKVTAGRRYGQLPVEVYALSYHVSYADLDLGTHTGATALQKRVHDAARSACKDLDKMYPRIPRDPSCVRNAEAAAKSQIDTAVTAAEVRRLIQQK